MFYKIWSYQAFHQKLKLFLLFSCLMGDVLFVWTAAYQTCLMRACVPRLLGGLYQLFDLCLIKHVLTVWPLTSTLVCLVTKQCLIVFGRQIFPVCSGLHSFSHHQRRSKRLSIGDINASAIKDLNYEWFLKILSELDGPLGVCNLTKKSNITSSRNFCNFLAIS